MEFKQYLIDTFRFNDQANRRLIEKIGQLPDKTEAIRLLSHLVNCQFKWMARITDDPGAGRLDWWMPLYTVEELGAKWEESLKPWLDYLAAKTEEELFTEVTFVGFEDAHYAATPADIALQLNYHSIHHRAQLQTELRRQGVTPDFVDYIRTKYRRLD